MQAYSANNLSSARFRDVKYIRIQPGYGNLGSGCLCIRKTEYLDLNKFYFKLKIYIKIYMKN